MICPPGKSMIFFAKCKLKIIELVTRACPYQATEEPSTSEGVFSPHMNVVLQPTIEVGGKEVAKYECHLCSQVFLRYTRYLSKSTEVA